MYCPGEPNEKLTDLATLVALVRTMKRFEDLRVKVNALNALQRLTSPMGKEIACCLLKGKAYKGTEEVKTKAQAVRILALGPGTE